MKSAAGGHSLTHSALPQARQSPPQGEIMSGLYILLTEILPIGDRQYIPNGGGTPKLLRVEAIDSVSVRKHSEDNSLVEYGGRTIIVKESFEFIENELIKAAS